MNPSPRWKLPLDRFSQWCFKSLCQWLIDKESVSSLFHEHLKWRIETLFNIFSTPCQVSFTLDGCLIISVNYSAPFLTRKRKSVAWTVILFSTSRTWQVKCYCIQLLSPAVVVSFIQWEVPSFSRYQRLSHKKVLKESEKVDELQNVGTFVIICCTRRYWSWMRNKIHTIREAKRLTDCQFA